MSLLTSAAANFDDALPPPAGDAITPPQFCQRQFRVLVAATANPRHYFRPLRLGENVRHRHEFSQIQAAQIGGRLSFVASGVPPDVEGVRLAARMSV